MNRKSKNFPFILIVFFTCSLFASLSIMAAPKNTYYDYIIIGDIKDVQFKNAITDLQRYLAQVTAKVAKVESIENWNKKKKSAIVLVTHDRCQEYFPDLTLNYNIASEGYQLFQLGKEENCCLVVSAKATNGLVNGVYGLLRELGFEFNLSSEAVPSVLPSHLSKQEITKSPLFAVRGVLPWYNFFNSPTTWDFIDHRSFIDQLVKSGANFITFHSYEHEPFVAVEENGEMVFGAGLCNTGKATWGTHPVPVNEFAYGINKLYSGTFYGASTTLQGYDSSTQIKKEKEVLRDALIYAKSRGLITSMGFAPLGDPTVPVDRERFIKEFTCNLEYYKNLDYIFIWQTETKGAQGHPLQYDTHILPDTRDPDSKIINYGEYRIPEFQRIVNRTEGIQPFFKNTAEGKIARATEGARLELFAKLAYRILSRYENAPKIVVAGWGGENYLLSEEYYEGLDKVLPKDVAFSSLESLKPKTYIDNAYFELPADRQRWPIPWLENDGDQWQPQPFLQTYEPMIQDLARSGSQGFLSIHWRTREVEDNFGYLVDYSWDTSINRKEFLRRKTLKYGDLAKEVEVIITSLDSLGYRWVGGIGQNECADFTWQSGEESKYKKVVELRDRLDMLLPHATANRSSLLWTRDRMNWVISYYEAEKCAERAKALLKRAQESGSKQEKIVLAKEALELLRSDVLAKAVRNYAQRITSRGEYGVLATINTKAVYDWRQMYSEAATLVGEDTKLMEQQWNPDLNIIFPRVISSVEVGKDLELEVIVLGGGMSTLYYRTLGSTKWKELPLTVKEGWIMIATIPAIDISMPGMEYKVVAKNGETSIEKSNVVTVFQQTTIESPLRKKEQNVIGGRPIITCHDECGKTLIEWTDLLYADSYEVIVNGVSEVSTPVTYYPYHGKLQAGDCIVIKTNGKETHRLILK